MTSESNAGKPLFGLDLLRALAIALVVWVHIGEHFFPAHLEWFVRTRADGVGLFFVLSGFLITLSLQRHLDQWGDTPKAFAHFWAKRVIRTIPPYFIAMLLFTGLVIALRSPLALPSGWSLVFLQNFAWPLKGGFGEGWSLSVEEWYYAVFIALGCLLPFRRVRSLMIAALMLMAVTFAYRAIGALRPESEMWGWAAQVQQTVLSRLDAPAFGVLAALSLGRWPDLWRSRKAALVCLVLGLMGTWGLTNILANLIDWRTTAMAAPRAFYASPTLEAAAWALLLVPARQLVSPGGLVEVLIRQVARSAFSIYLTHLSIVALLLAPAIGTGSVRFAAFLVLLAVVSQAFYWLVERPAWKARTLVDRLARAKSISPEAGPTPREAKAPQIRPSELCPPL